jgi:hypothetical protein
VCSSDLKFGNKVDKDGEYLFESQPFLDEEGNPIILEDASEKKPTQDTEQSNKSDSE